LHEDAIKNGIRAVRISAINDFGFISPPKES
jgi:hypothetical protein